jgi:alpha-tubulin suppressor-like RCC1 family protein
MEYGIILVVIALVVVALVQFIGNRTSAALCDVSVGLNGGGGVAGMGDNSSGNLGTGNTNQAKYPTAINFCAKQLAAFWAGTLALKPDGTVWAWGSNDSSELGAGFSGAYSTSPIQIKGLSNVVQVAASAGEGLAVKADGTVWEWGALGATPTQITGITGTVKAATGGGSTLSVLTSSGAVWVWGYGGDGELGTGGTYSLGTPTQVTLPKSAIAIGAGYTHMTAVLSDGTVYWWGLYSTYPSGTIMQSLSPVQEAGITNITAISTSPTDQHDVALRSDGTVWAWGFNGNGQLGDGDPGWANSTTPVQVCAAGQTLPCSQFLTNVTAIGADTNSSFATKSDGSFWGWGWDNNCQLGDNCPSPSLNAPIRIPGIGGAGWTSGVISVAGAGTSTVFVSTALKPSG